MTDFPLQGLKVLDFSRVLAGPFATRMLSDLGADVVKIEPPEGDITRHFGKQDGGVAGFYLQQNIGKRNICLDLKTAGARELVLKLVAVSDIVVENFRPGTTARLGIDYDTLSAENPRLVYCSITGYGDSGPYRDRSAMDLVVQAVSGLMATCGLSSATMSVESLAPSPPPPTMTPPLPPAAASPAAGCMLPCGRSTEGRSTGLATPSACTLTSGACTHFLSAERHTLQHEAICSG